MYVLKKRVLSVIGILVFIVGVGSYIWFRTSHISTPGRIFTTGDVVSKNQQHSPVGWKTYHNEKYGFEFDYPPEMGVLKSESNDELVVIDFPSEKDPPFTDDFFQVTSVPIGEVRLSQIDGFLYTFYPDENTFVRVKDIGGYYDTPSSDEEVLTRTEDSGAVASRETEEYVCPFRHSLNETILGYGDTAADIVLTNKGYALLFSVGRDTVQMRKILDSFRFIGDTQVQYADCR